DKQRQPGFSKSLLDSAEALPINKASIINTVHIVSIRNPRLNPASIADSADLSYGHSERQSDE
ncbi:MAG: hypothetical protein P1V97_03155, partial [Planctomycetota bacterium]|nr:hypothetical protein [Planctomycetota bacterium]